MARLISPRWWAGLGAGIVAVGLAAAQAPAPDGLYAKAQSARGRMAFAEHCAACHGADLGGGAAPTLTGPFWATWRGRSLGELLGLMKGSMPADAPGSLDDGTYADILAFMLETGGYPAGPTDLPASPEALDTRKIGPKP